MKLMITNERILTKHELKRTVKIIRSCTTSHHLSIVRDWIARVVLPQTDADQGWTILMEVFENGNKIFGHNFK